MTIKTSGIVCLSFLRRLFIMVFGPSLRHSINTHSQVTNAAKCLVIGRSINKFIHCVCANSNSVGDTAIISTF